MKKRTKIRIASFSAALVLTLTGFTVETQMMLNDSKRQLEYSYRRSLNDLTNYISDMEYSLRKSTYANTPTMRGEISAELLEKSSAAKAAMSTLPFSEERSETISRFISQVGDYAMALSRKTAAGKEIEDEEFQNLENMGGYAVKLSQGLQEVQAHLSVEKAEVGKVQRVLNNVDNLKSIPNFDDSLDEVAKEFTQFPSLLYDGPFSDHIMQRDPQMLQNETEISLEAAAKKAAAFFGCKQSDLQAGNTWENSLPSYIFHYGTAQVHITKRGGSVSYFKDSRFIQETKLSYDQALKSAQAFLNGLGIQAHKESYYVMNDNTCTINFSHLEKTAEADVICYPDLLKVVVELNRGDVMEYDATGYLMNHHDRDFTAPKLTLEEAKGNVSENLRIQGYEMAMIPTPGLDEVYCYEFSCKDKHGTDVLVYINTQTGMEEQIFILTYSDNGILTF